MAKINFLGGCREVGRSAVLIESDSGNQIMLDYGVRFSEDERLPQSTELTNLKAVALTHCHVDHSGGIPALYKDVSIPFLTNPVTLDLLDLLLKDMVKISSYPYPFGLRELQNAFRNAKFINDNGSIDVSDDLKVTFFNAGHVPGSVSILVEVDGKRILYTGDINTKDTCLVNPTDPSKIPEIDALIIESTYSLREHPPRSELEVEFYESVQNITDNGGLVLIPAFGVARSQEAMLILAKYGYDGKIFMDGLSKQVSQLFLKYPEALKLEDEYREALKRVRYVYKRKDKNLALNSNGVIISPSGMLKGGSALKYIEHVLKDPDSGIYLVGYQVEGTPGHNLLENAVFEFEDKRDYGRAQRSLNIKAQCDTAYFDFSSHADQRGLHSYVDNLKFRNGSKQIFCVHGDNKSVTTFSSELGEKNFNAVAPEIGEKYKI